MHYDFRSYSKDVAELLALAGKLSVHSTGLRAVLAVLGRRRGALHDPGNVACLRLVVGAVMERLGVDANGECVGSQEDPAEPVEPVPSSHRQSSRSLPGEVERLFAFYGVRNDR